MLCLLLKICLKGGLYNMKFIIQRDRLVQSVQEVMKAVTSRTTIPILTGIKISSYRRRSYFNRK